MEAGNEWFTPKCPHCFDNLTTMDEESRRKHIDNCEGICTTTN